MTMMCPERSLCSALLAAAFGPTEDRDELIDGDAFAVFSPVREDGSFVAGVGPCEHLWSADLMVDTDVVWEATAPTMQAAFVALAGAVAARLERSA